MKIKALLLMAFACLICSVSYAQGIQFQQPSSWNELIEKAKKEKKHIFIDLYATWCGPCKEMDATVFNTDTVGTFMNEHFLSVKIQGDSTANESEYSRKWRKIGDSLNNKYKIDAVPGYLFLTQEGELAAKVIGLIKPAGAFQERAKKSLDVSQQYGTLLRRYQSGDKSPELIKNLTKEALILNEFDVLQTTHDEFVDNLGSSYTREDLIAIYCGMKNTNSRGFDFLRKDILLKEKVLGEVGKISAILTDHLRFETHEKFITGKENKVDWNSLESFVKQRAPEVAEQVIFLLRLSQIYAKDFEAFAKLKMDYYDLYAKKFDHNAAFIMNNDLWEIFERSNNKSTLSRAAKWSKYANEHVYDSDFAVGMDTYANLLYKSGDQANAIKFQKVAVEMANKLSNEDQKEYLDNLKKMEAGLPTWNE